MNQTHTQVLLLLCAMQYINGHITGIFVHLFASCCFRALCGANVSVCKIQTLCAACYSARDFITSQTSIVTVSKNQFAFIIHKILSFY